MIAARAAFLACPSAAREGKQAFPNSASPPARPGPQFLLDLLRALSRCAAAGEEAAPEEAAEAEGEAAGDGGRRADAQLAAGAAGAAAMSASEETAGGAGAVAAAEEEAVLVNAAGCELPAGAGPPGAQWQWARLLSCRMQ